MGGIVNEYPCDYTECSFSFFPYCNLPQGESKSNFQITLPPMIIEVICCPCSIQRPTNRRNGKIFTPLRPEQTGIAIQYVVHTGWSRWHCKWLLFWWCRYFHNYEHCLDPIVLVSFLFHKSRKSLQLTLPRSVTTYKRSQTIPVAENFDRWLLAL